MHNSSFIVRYGFEQKPYLLLSAKPKLFNRQVTFSYVTDWIEKKLIELVEVRASVQAGCQAVLELVLTVYIRMPMKAMLGHYMNPYLRLVAKLLPVSPLYMQKKVVQPNMLDLTVTALNSGFPEDRSSSTTIV